MSIVALSGRHALLQCNGKLSIAPRSVNYAVRTLSTTLQKTASNTPPQSQWRKQALASLNDRSGRPTIDLKNSRSKFGFLPPDVYLQHPTYPAISLDPLPEVETADIERSLDSTRPAPLETVTRKPEDSAFSYYLRLGRSYYAFYKTGLKNIRANWKEFSVIKGFIQPFTLGAVARYGGSHELHLPRMKEVVPVPHITRREFVLHERLKHDLWKLLPFGIVLLICGEFTPLAILVLGDRVVPYTCRIPAQQKAAKDNAVKRFKIFLEEMKKLTARSRTTMPINFLDFTPRDRLEHPWRRDLLFAYLVGQTNFYRLPLPLSSGFYWYFILQQRLFKYWDHIFCETVLIRREGGFAKLTPQDIYEYALHYGSFTLLVIMQREIAKGNYDFVNEDLKKVLVPVLEAEADVMLNDDFTRLDPNMHWMRAYRDSIRWCRTRDVETAVRLMKDMEKDKKSKETSARKGEEKDQP